MVNNQLSEWFRQGLDKGYSLSELKKKALEKYSEKQVNGAVSKIKGKPKSFVWIIVVVVLAGLIFAGYYFGKPYLSKPDPCLDQTEEVIVNFCNDMKSDNITRPMSNCMKSNPGFSEENCKIIIYEDFARFTKNPLYCNKITSEPAREKCLELLK